MSNRATTIVRKSSVDTRMITITPRLTISTDEIAWRFSGSGGPGGQHANTANTRVEAIFSIDDSPSLSDEDRERLRRRYGSILRIVVSDERSQLRNREIAIERLGERLREGLARSKRRTPTKPTRGSVERRLEEKKNTARKKQERSRREDD